jgi:MOSC domain-containing protein YiiM
LCLWSADVIDAFAADGHPIAPGSAGENITIRGLDWSQVRSGVLLRIGEVLAEASLFALPCRSNAPWFRDGDFNLMHHDRGPVSRVYAWVREPGRIQTGDPVVLEP